MSHGGPAEATVIGAGIISDYYSNAYRHPTQYLHEPGIRCAGRKLSAGPLGYGYDFHQPDPKRAVPAHLNTSTIKAAGQWLATPAPTLDAKPDRYLWWFVWRISCSDGHWPKDSKIFARRCRYSRAFTTGTIERHAQCRCSRPNSRERRTQTQAAQRSAWGVFALLLLFHHGTSPVLIIHGDR